MRVLLDASVLQQPITGIAKAALGLYASLLELRPDIEVTALHRLPLKCPLDPHIRSVQAGRILPKRAWRRLAIPLYAMRHRPGVVHFPWNGDVPRLWSDALVVTTYHDVLPVTIPGWFASEREERECRRRVQSDLDRTDLVITDSEYSKREIAKHFRVTSEPVVVYLGPPIPTEPASARQGAHEDGNYFLYVGGYDRRKGIEPLVRTFIALRREKRISSRLVLTGARRFISHDLQALISEGVEAGFVEEAGYVADSELHALYSRAKALVYPSRYEGFGLPPLEAMALGCPVITTRCTSIPEVCGDAVCYVDPDNDKELGEALVNLECSAELRNELKAKGASQSAKFSWRRSAEIFLTAIEKALAQRGAHSPR